MYYLIKYTKKSNVNKGVFYMKYVKEISCKSIQNDGAEKVYKNMKAHSNEQNELTITILERR